ncbi:MAG TPA: FUSC family protein [Ideonella sp.]|uniref:FUSC family protein n=1 Tax=Ideonella sp. TaxID=1929293 RepID=UPI002D145D99|nr:FUSC family protein [Ideonella sp.]HSI48843.1 FUSC family protein [Ideonella sp.]
MTLLLRSLKEAIVTMLAALATLGCALVLAPAAGTAVLGVVLCLSLSRSQLDRDRRGRIEAAIALPLVSLAAFGVAMLLHEWPWWGAAAFVLVLSASIWLRRFGDAGRKAGRLIALPFVVLLITPHLPASPGGSLPAWLLTVVVALLALFWVSLLHALARRLRFLPGMPPEPMLPAAPQAGGLRPVASSRMAIQMGLALAAGFAVGHLFFGPHWAWVVLTAFIVGSGNQGRLDVVHKSGLRVLGAAAGTVIALAASGGLGGHDRGTVALILLAVFLGLWLRPLGYAWWALFVTLALALLQGFEGLPAQEVLGLRLAEIIIGALIGVAAAWFVLPVRSTDVLRRRIADALAALAEAGDPAATERSAQPFLAQLANAEKVAPAFRAARRLTRRWHPLQPADWVDTLAACQAPACRMLAQGEAPGQVRKALAAARKAMREPAEIGPALLVLRQALDSASAVKLQA